MLEVLEKTNNQQKFAQYFTPKDIANFMIGMANISQCSKILEPSCGEGVFLELLQKKGFHHLTAYEVDRQLNVNFPYVKGESFVTAKIKENFDLVIGNPPYIRWKNLDQQLKQELVTQPLWQKYCNALCDYLYIFILKSIELLHDEGELIFICPEYWMNTTHSEPLRNYMMERGFFTHIFHFSETPIFDKVSVSTIIFKFIKTQRKGGNIEVIKVQNCKKITQDMLEKLKIKKVMGGVEYLSIPQFKTEQRWILYPESVQQRLYQLELSCKKDLNTVVPSLFFDKVEIDFSRLGDVCDIGNGLVSGLDKAFQIGVDELNENEKQATLNVIKAKNLLPYTAVAQTPYIFIQDASITETDFQKKYPNFYAQLQPYKEALSRRYQYNREIHYWQWVFLRNINLFKRTEKRIFVPCKERISHKNYFRFALVDQGIYPTQDVTAIFKKTATKESIEYIVAYLNQPFIFEWLKCNGIVKGNIVEFSEKPLASIPFKKINWQQPCEVSTHDLITQLVKKFMLERKNEYLDKITTLFKQLLRDD